MKKYEYLILSYHQTKDHKKMVNELNKRGAEGWSLVSVENKGKVKTCYFKRKL